MGHGSLWYHTTPDEMQTMPFSLPERNVMPMLWLLSATTLHLPLLFCLTILISSDPPNQRFTHSRDPPLQGRRVHLSWWDQDEPVNA